MKGNGCIQKWFPFRMLVGKFFITLRKVGKYICFQLTVDNEDIKIFFFVMYFGHKN